MTGAITSYIDVAQLVLYAFWIFFAGLIFYLRREDRREGYPLEADLPDRYKSLPGPQLLPLIPEPKTFLLAHGGTATAPNSKLDRRKILAERVAIWPGAPLQPTGDPMRDAVGPAAYVEREEEPERTFDGEPMIVPLRVASDHFIEPRDPDPRGMEVLGADSQLAGVVRDVWVDRAEPQIRYLEVELPAPPAGTHEGDGEAGTVAAIGAARVLLPIGFARIDRWQRRVRVRSILAAQFAHVPGLKAPDVVTKREEDRICAYYAGGHLYATPDRLEPLL